MNKAEDKPIVLTKRKNIQTVIDYCLEQKISFNASPRPISNDEWEVELNINNIKDAIALGMFVRENKLELYGIATSEVIKPKTAAAPAAKKTESKEPAVKNLMNDFEPTPQPEMVEESKLSSALSFDLNTSSN
jgi:hypothetical protein